MSSRSRGWWLLAPILVVVIGLAALRIAPPRSTAPEGARGGSAILGQPLPSLAGTTGWSAGVPTADSLAGHVVVVAFLSLDLPSSLSALPALEAWNDAYSRYGVRILGVHVPAFAFAVDSAASAHAVRRLGVHFPVGLDPSLAAWRAFGARGPTPRIVVAGAAGRVVLDRQGGGSLPEAERSIRGLVSELHSELRFPTGAEPAAAEIENVEHAPVQLGRARVERGPLRSATPGRQTSFTAQLRYQVEGEPYTPYPVGRWTPGADGLTAARGGAENFVALRYDAAALGAVLGPSETGPVRVWILRDERWLTRQEAGADVQLDGRGASFVMVDEPRLYALTRSGRGEHVVKLSPDAPGATVYAFTFEPFEAAEARP